MRNEIKPQPVYLKDYQAPDYLIDSINLHIELKEQDTTVRTELKIKRNTGDPTQALVLHGEEQELKSVDLDGKLIDSSRYKFEDDQLVIHDVPEEFTLEIISVIQPQKNTALSGLYRSGKMFCTQCESQGFRRITFYPDRPDVMSMFTTTIVADKTLYPVLLSNGNPTDKGDLSDNRHFVTWHDPHKKPAYLFALVAGDLACVKDSYVTKSGKDVRLELFVEHGNEDKCQHGLDSLKKAMSWDEQTYGLEYDLDIYMIVAAQDFNMGAMENKGLNIFNAKYVLANKATATDKDFQNVELVIGHEYFHNWTGNRVTCRDWFQLSLKEGLTVFREQQFSATTGVPTVKRIEDVSVVRSRQFPEDKGPMAHPVRPASYIEINNFYTMTVYYKGSEVIRMMHTLLGQDGFRKGMDLYFERHDGQAVTCDDFVAAMSDANKIDLTQFKRWYYQAGTPEVKAKGDYDANQKTYTLTLKQSCAPTADNSPKDPFYMPVKIGLLTKEGQPITPVSDDLHSSDATSAVVVFNHPEQTIVFKDVPSKPIPSLFGNFSAPVICHFAYKTEELATLMAHDSDGFNRWDAAQRLYTGAILTRMANNHSKLEGIATALRQVLENIEDPGLVASILTFPSLEYLGEGLTQIPILSLIQAKDITQRELAEELYDELFATYKLCCEKDDKSLENSSMQWRSLKNTCLYLLGQTHSEEILGVCVDEYQNASCMTEMMGALTGMNDYDQKPRNDCFDDFYNNWQADPLVVNKWLSLQATQKIEHALDHVKSLIEHPAFDMSNPNKVYSLIGGFCHNPRFHQANGAAYDFLADLVIQLNAKNPQVASRMIEPLSFYKRYAQPHQDLMHKALVKIHKEPKLSPDIYEIVTKSLGDSAA